MTMDGDRTMRARSLTGYALAVFGTAALVLVLIPVRDDIEPLSKGWAFLTLVVLCTMVGGLGPGVVASVLAFLTYNYFFLPPYETFRVGQAEYVVVLFVFLALSALISVLLARARARATTAEARQRELQLQQDLARALVQPTPGDENYRLVLQLIVSRMRFRHAALLIQGDTGLERVAHAGEPEPQDEGAQLERIPLVVGRRSLGLLLLSGREEPLGGPDRRTLEAFTDQLALVLERDRLLGAVVRMEQERLRAGDA